MLFNGVPVVGGIAADCFAASVKLQAERLNSSGSDVDACADRDHSTNEHLATG